MQNEVVRVRDRAEGIRPVTKVEPRRMVVVDDNLDAAESLAELLGISGHQVKVAYDGRSALEVVRAHAPDVVLLDIGLPRMDGYAVARELRAEHGDRLTLIALTGYGQEEDRRRTKDAGFDHHFVKPLDLQLLVDVLAGLPSPI
jgi:CheY-like chemotaxis protein